MEKVGCERGRAEAAMGERLTDQAACGPADGQGAPLGLVPGGPRGARERLGRAPGPGKDEGRTRRPAGPRTAGAPLAGSLCE